MRHKDKLIIQRLREIIFAVPFGESFKSSMPAVGALQYQQDMRELRPALARVMDAILFDENPEPWLHGIEDWIACRQHEDWCRSSQCAITCQED